MQMVGDNRDGPRGVVAPSWTPWGWLGTRVVVGTFGDGWEQLGIMAVMRDHPWSSWGQLETVGDNWAPRGWVGTIPGASGLWSEELPGALQPPPHLHDPPGQSGRSPAAPTAPPSSSLQAPAWKPAVLQERPGEATTASDTPARALTGRRRCRWAPPRPLVAKNHRKPSERGAGGRKTHPEVSPSRQDAPAPAAPVPFFFPTASVTSPTSASAAADAARRGGGGWKNRSPLLEAASPGTVEMLGFHLLPSLTPNAPGEVPEPEMNPPARPPAPPPALVHVVPQSNRQRDGGTGDVGAAERHLHS